MIGRDQILDDISLYWFTNSGASSSRFYWENNNNNFSAAAQMTTQIKVPVAITVFPHEIYRAPESWSRQAYPSLYYFHELDKAVTSRLGSSRKDSVLKSGRPSDRCVHYFADVSTINGGFGPT